MRWAAVVLAGCAVGRSPAPRPAHTDTKVVALASDGSWIVADEQTLAARDAAPANDAVDHADAAIDALVAGEFAAVVAAFDPTSNPPTSAQIASTWRARTKGLGTVRGWARVDRTYQDGFEVRVVRIELERGALQCLVTLDRNTFRLRSLFVTPTAPPAAYVDRSRFREVPVRVGAAPYELDGTLVLPNGTGPFPAAVLVHGSGPNDRDASVGALKPFTDIAEGLASKGVAVLRYDKRTYVYGDRLDNAITIDDEAILDAIAAVHLVESRADIDRSRVVVIGHSLGGLLAPEIAVRAGGVAGVALLAPPGRPPWEIIRDQMRYLRAPRETLAAVERAVIDLQLGADTGRLVGMPYSYWRDWATRDGVAMAKRFARRVLVLHGTRDYQVTSADFTTWETGLRGEKLASLVTLPDVNHMFVAGRGAPSPLEYKVPGHVDVRLIAHLVQFALAAK